MNPLLNDEHLLIGASWYPEMWPPSEWPKDLHRMQEVGFNVVRLFEFAWKRLEPKEGNYDFRWAHQVMDLCHEAEIRVMVGTPTAAPPAWLTSKYPEVLAVKPDGTGHRHGMRKHFSHVSLKYRELAARIAERMAVEFSGHPALFAWQIDNEMSGSDYSEASRLRFHSYLRDRFGSIEALNEAWGLQFWSQAYDCFSQIPMPTSAVGSVEVPERHHPSLLLAIADFFSSEWSSYIGIQCEAIRCHSHKPITTNMCGAALSSDWFEHNKRLDRVGFSIYKDVDHYEMALGSFERMRGEKPGRPYWLLETAPNWSGCGKQWNIHHNAAGVTAFSWLSILLGGSLVLYWQWRAHWAGQEMLHGTCVDATGAWSPNKEAWSALASQFARQSAFLLAHPTAAAGIGMVLDSRATWAFSIDPVDDQMAYDKVWREQYYLPLVHAHLWREVTDLSNDWELRYKLLCLPHVPIVGGDVRNRLEAWVAAGGRLLLGPFSGHRSDHFTCFTEQTYGGLETLIGAKADMGFTAHWREKAVRVEFSESQCSSTRGWCESFLPNTERAHPIAYYQGEGEYGDGRIAAVEHSFGEGKVVTLGCMVEPQTYVAQVQRLAAEVGILPMTTGDRDVIVIPRAERDGRTVGWGMVNLAEKPSRITLPEAGRDRFTGKEMQGEVELAPLAVLLIEAVTG